MDIHNAYIVVFKDQAGTIHYVPFPKENDRYANRKAEAMIRGLQEAGIEASKYGTFQKPAQAA